MPIFARARPLSADGSKPGTLLMIRVPITEIAVPALRVNMVDAPGSLD
jgi:hypothetical protein